MEPEFFIDSVGRAEILYIGSATKHDEACSEEILVTLLLNGREVTSKIDTGAKCNVLSFDTVKRIPDAKIWHSKRARLKGFTGGIITSLGTTELKCQLPNSNITQTITFQVVNSETYPLLGLRDSLGLRLIQKGPGLSNMAEVYSVTAPSSSRFAEQMTTEFAELFNDDLGELPTTYNIVTDPDVKPVIRPVQRVPPAIKDQLKETLDHMSSKGIIAPIKEPTEAIR